MSSLSLSRTPVVRTPLELSTDSPSKIRSYNRNHQRPKIGTNSSNDPSTQTPSTSRILEERPEDESKGGNSAEMNSSYRSPSRRFSVFGDTPMAPRIRIQESTSVKSPLSGFEKITQSSPSVLRDRASFLTPRLSSSTSSPFSSHVRRRNTFQDSTGDAEVRTSYSTQVFRTPQHAHTEALRNPNRNDPLFSSTSRTPMDSKIHRSEFSTPTHMPLSLMDDDSRIPDSPLTIIRNMKERKTPVSKSDIHVNMEIESSPRKVGEGSSLDAVSSTLVKKDSKPVERDGSIAVEYVFSFFSRRSLARVLVGVLLLLYGAWILLWMLGIVSENPPFLGSDNAELS